MYRRKLAEQLVLLEERQKECGIDKTSEFVALSQNILLIAEKIDELDQLEKIK